jgi:hypothetical protein
VVVAFGGRLGFFWGINGFFILVNIDSDLVELLHLLSVVGEAVLMVGVGGCEGGVLMMIHWLFGRLNFLYFCVDEFLNIVNNVNFEIEVLVFEIKALFMQFLEYRIYLILRPFVRIFDKLVRHEIALGYCLGFIIVPPPKPH